MIYTTQVEHMAHVVKGLLEEEGIDTILFDQHDSAYTVIGHFELYVHPDNEERAKRIIEDHND